jgi:1-acyl-sn-glycerol-3-phosphate acyltransferase
MRPPPVLVRRAVLDPLWPPAAVVLAALLLVVAAAGAVTWPVTGRGRISRLALLAALYVLLNAGLLVACAALWLRHPVPGRRDGERWQDSHAGVLRWLLAMLRAAAGPLLGFEVTLHEPSGAAQLREVPLLILARHAGPGDSFTLADLLLSRYRRRPRIVLKEILQWDPGLDVVLNRMSACFLPARPAAGADLAGQLAALARTLTGSDAMLIFPEGGNWTPLRYSHAVARLRRQHALRQAAAAAARHPNVLPPRPAGVLACLAARPDLDVVVVAHTGLDDLVSPAQVWRALPLTGRPMAIRWWHQPAEGMPADPAGQLTWLQRQWAMVDAWIQAQKDDPDPRGAAAGDPGRDDAGSDGDGAGPLLETPG